MEANNSKHGPYREKRLLAPSGSCSSTGSVLFWLPVSLGVLYFVFLAHNDVFRQTMNA